MTPFALWFSLGLCTGYWPNDAEATFSQCRDVFDSKMRQIDPSQLELGFGISGASLSHVRLLTYGIEYQDGHGDACVEVLRSSQSPSLLFLAQR